MYLSLVALLTSESLIILKELSWLVDLVIVVAYDCEVMCLIFGLFSLAGSSILLSDDRLLEDVLLSS